MSYQPEERYWTDYLRVALPVVGLLLMLGLFWYWASNVIGNSGDSPKPTQAANVVVITAAPPTETAPAAINITPQVQPTSTIAAGGPATENSAGAGNAASNSNAANPTPTTASNDASSGNSGANASSGGSTNPSKFGDGDTVQTNTDSVNVRSDHSTDADAVETIAAPGTELNVTGSGVKSGDYVWIPVTDPATGVSGWVADSLVDAVTP